MTISTKINYNAPTLSMEVFVGGMGTQCTPNDAPVYLECTDGKWELFVWSDINQEGPTHRIDMSGAFETNRD